MSNSQNRVAIVTGTTSGIGEAIARKFVAEGIRVVGNAIHFMVSQPPHVHLSDIVVRPTRQDYP